jgi:serine/threonine-protein kinase
MTAESQLNAALAGRYEIAREVGQGGMATVYLARDLRHDRQVALKVLHPDLAAALGAERFLAEIKTTANLQHPHILPLHDSGEADGHLFYVMPFVAGETLRARLERENVLPIDDALRIAREVLSALDYAHRHGVVHRDIKPENILLHDGSALVADFGIALAVQSAGGQRMTQTGLSLGTPQYMSPEQAMGERQIDGRADIYAMGAVLYEMLTGEPPFTGASVQAIVAKVMTERPTSPRIVRDTVPTHVEAAVMRSLAKLPADRFAMAKDFSDALSGTAATASSPFVGGEPRTPWRSAAIAASIVAVAAIAAFAWALRRTSAVSGARVDRFELPIAVEPHPVRSAVMSNYGRTMDVSADGSRIVYVGRDSSGTAQLYVRDLSSLGTRALPGTRGALAVSVAPDGHAAAFIDAASLRTVSLDGGSSAPLVQRRVRSVFWCRDGKIYFGEMPATRMLISRVAPSGASEEKVLDYPRLLIDIAVLPDGRGLLAGGALPGRGFAAISFADGKPRPIADGARPVYSPAGYLVFSGANNELMGARFDAKRLAPTSPIVVIAEPAGAVRVNQALMTDDGSLLYQAGAEESRELVWVTRAGVTTLVDSSLRGNIGYPALSRDGRRVAYTKDTDLWLRDLDHGSNALVARRANYPAWKADGQVLSYYHQDSTKGREYRLWMRNADDGTPERLLVATGDPVESLWSPDGTWLVYRTAANTSAGGDVLAIRPGLDSAPAKIVATPAGELQPAMSFDGRWLAYVSNETGRDEVYVAPFPNPGGARWMVSTDGGTEPAWSHSGTELFYRDAAQNLVSIAVQTTPRFVAGVHHTLFSAIAFETYPGHREYEVGPGDQRFLMIRPTTARATRVVLVRNWVHELERALRQK